MTTPNGHAELRPLLTDNPAPISQLFAEAEQALERYEVLPVGAVSLDCRMAARDAFEAVYDRATAALGVGAIEPLGVDVWKDWEEYTATFRRHSWVEEVAGLIASAAPTYPRLVRVALSAATINNLANMWDWPGEAPEKPFVMQQQYLRDVAVSLAGIAEYEPAASILAGMQKLERRFEATMQQHQEHARAEQARIEREALERTEAVRSAESARRETLAQFFETQTRTFSIGSSVVIGRAVASALRGERALDVLGYPVQLGIVAIEDCYNRTLAADLTTGATV